MFQWCCNSRSERNNAHDTVGQKSSKEEMLTVQECRTEVTKILGSKSEITFY